MLNRLKQQQASAYKRKAEQFSVKKVQGGGALKLGGAMALEDMQLDRMSNFEGDEYDPFKVGGQKLNYDLSIAGGNH